jgi:hypothetical protein
MEQVAVADAAIGSTPMSVQNETATTETAETGSHISSETAAGVLLTDQAAVKVKTLLEQEGRKAAPTSRFASRSSPAVAQAFATSSISMTALSTATPSMASAASTSSSTR